MKIRLFITAAILVSVGILTRMAYDSSRLYLVYTSLGDTEAYRLFFETAVVGIPVALLVGVFLGTLNYKERPVKIVNGKVERHDEIMFLQHWTNAVGIVILLVTGVLLGTLFIPRMVHSTEMVGFMLNMHYVGILFYFFGASYYVSRGVVTGELKEMMPRKGDVNKMIGHYAAMFTKKEAPKEDKFIAAERVIFPLWIIGLAGITFSGIVKIFAYFLSMPSGLMGTMTFFHGVFAIYLGVLLAGHIFAAAIMSWPMLRSMLTGVMTEQHIKKNHQNWYEEIKALEKEQPLDKAN